MSIIAHRWAEAARQLGIRVEVMPVDLDRILLAVADSSRDVIVLVGMPSRAVEAQALVDAVGSSDRRRIVLWDRAGHSPDDSDAGLERLDGIKEVWILNPLLYDGTRRRLRSASVTVVPLAIPDVFFASVPLRHVAKYGAFIGRFSANKGALLLAEKWVHQVFPITGVPLIMAGRGLAQGAGEAGIRALAETHPQAIKPVRLMSESSRARFLASATMVAFPGRDDYLPQALGESFAAGAVVAATDIVGYRPLARPRVTSLRLEVDLSNLSEVFGLASSGAVAVAELAVAGRDLARSEHSFLATSRTFSDLFVGSPTA